MTPSDKFSALLHTQWVAVRSLHGGHENEIQGYWAEDNSTFTITCPAQLRDLLVELQNVLATKYVDARDRLRNAQAEMLLLDKSLESY